MCDRIRTCDRRFAVTVRPLSDQRTTTINITIRQRSHPASHTDNCSLAVSLCVWGGGEGGTPHLAPHEIKRKHVRQMFARLVAYRAVLTQLKLSVIMQCTTLGWNIIRYFTLAEHSEWRLKRLCPLQCSLENQMRLKIIYMHKHRFWDARQKDAT